MRNGMTSNAAGSAAVGEAYQMMLRQASMLSYKNAFVLLGIAVVFLSPLPFLMRLPPKRPAKPGTAPAEPAPEELMAH
jgi:DHA2 family multidrug resistance protein